MANNIPNGSITTDMLADGCVTAPKIAGSAVTSSKLDPKTNGIINVKSYGAAGNGVTDDSLAIKAAIAAAGGAEVIFPPGVYMVSSPLMLNSNTVQDGTEWRCVNVPSNTTLRFLKGAVLKLNVKGGSVPNNTRVLVISGVQNVTIFGYLEIDGGLSAMTGTPQEQLHGLFIYNSQDIYVESAYCHHTGGDNCFVGGTEAAPSQRVKINYFRGVKAGRRNFVVHYVDQLHVGTAFMDNTAGGTTIQPGVTTNYTGFYSLDVEPDSFTGSRLFYQRFDYIQTVGMGNSMSTGTTNINAKNWIVDIGTFEMLIKKGSTDQPAFLQYAVTLRCDKMLIRSTDALESVAYQTNYACYSNIGTLEVYNFNGKALYLQTGSTGQRAHVSIGTLKMDGNGQTSSAGIRNEGVDLKVDLLDAYNVAGTVLDVFSTLSDCQMTFNQILARDSGKNQMILLSQYNANTFDLYMNNITVFDTRSTKVNRIIEYQTQLAMLRTTIGAIHNPYGIQEWGTSYGNFSRIQKLVGGTLLPSVYIVEGSPEGVLSAPVGSLALRTDGGAQSSLYVKESGTGNTGWAVK